jgi:hypothetical protein
MLKKASPNDRDRRAEALHILYLRKLGDTPT